MQIATVNATLTARLDELERRMDRVQDLAAVARELARARVAAELQVLKDTGGGT